MLAVAGALVLLAGVQLFIFPENTDRYFAWTIDVSLTAAFLGAGYWASVAFEWSAAAQRTWVRARISVPSVLVFTSLTLVASLSHLELFHLDPSNAFSTRAVTWLWLAIYAVVPPVLLWLLLRQRRAPGEDSPARLALPTWLRIVLGIQAIVLLGLGGGLFVTSGVAASLWPWPLTPLTSQAVGAWLLGVGVGAAHAVVEDDLERAKVAMVSYVVLAILQLVALARFPEAIESTGGGVAYVAFLLSMLVVGICGWVAAPGRLIPRES